MFSPFSAWTQEARIAKSILNSDSNPCPFPEWAENLISRNCLETFLKKRPLPAFFDNLPYYESLYLTPKAIRYQMDSVGLVVHPGFKYEPWRVELARFPVPHRYIGVIRGFEQFMGVADFAPVPSVTSIVTYGDPFTDQFNGVRGRWFMRLFPFDGSVRPWINQLNPPDEQPGLPYSDFPEQSGIWFATHSDSANSVRFPVPGGFELAVFWECDGLITERPAVSAAFKGGIQSSLNKLAMEHYLGSWS
ncbi:MAG: hypothetical protein PHO67_08820 [Candidatus Omnitrophica bacterium]|nr:hypothetical protein [Candidatus Omnitrophota bacterium]